MRGSALVLTESVCTSYERGYGNAEAAQYLLVSVNLSGAVSDDFHS